MARIDARDKRITEINREIRALAQREDEHIVIEYPDARHHLCVGLLAAVRVTIQGSAGYFCAGLCDGPTVEVANNVGWGVADNLLAGTIIVGRNAGAVPGVGMRDGTLVVRGNLGSRAGQIMKGGLILCGGRANFMAGYMMMGGRIVICGDSGRGVGQDMINGAVYVGGKIEELGSGVQITDMSAAECEEVRTLLDRYRIPAPAHFQKITSTRQFHHYSAYERSERDRDDARPAGKALHVPRGSLWNARVVEDITAKAEIGRYRVRGYGAFREVPSFSDLAFTFDPERITERRDVRKRCSLKTTLGGRFGGRPLALSMPVMIAPMSYGALSKNCKIALARASSMVGTATNTGEGGMMPEERAEADQMIYQCLAGRYGFSPHDMRRADGIELYISQGAKPGLGGQLMGKKITADIARIRGIPPGIDLRSPSRHPDVLGADDLVIKIEEFREATDWRVPISLKIGAGRLKDDIKIALKDNVDFIEIDGMQGGTGASSEVVTENMGIPSLAAIIQAMDGLREIEREGELQIVLMGGIRDGADAAKAIALGADAVSVGTAAMIACGCIACMRCHTGRCIRGIATQTPELVARLDVDRTARQVANFLEGMATELAAITLACGKNNVRDLDRTDLVALTPQAAAITGLPVAGRAPGHDTRIEGCGKRVDSVEIPPDWETIGAAKEPDLPVADRVQSFSEVKLSMVEAAAMGEAARCMRCDYETNSYTYSRDVREHIYHLARDVGHDEAAGLEFLHRKLAEGRERPPPQEHAPSFDDLVFLPANLTRLVIDPYREPCNTRTVIGARAEAPLALTGPLLIGGLLFSGLSDAVLAALCRGAHCAGIAMRVPVGLDLAVENLRVVRVAPLTERPESIEDAAAVEFAPEDPGVELDAGILHRAAEAVRSCAPPVPVGIGIYPGRVAADVRAAVEAGLDFVTLSAMGPSDAPGGIELGGRPKISVLTEAVEELRAMRREGDIDLIYFGCARDGGDLAKALALGASAIMIGQAALIAVGDCKGRSGADRGSECVLHFVEAILMEAAILTRGCGKTDLHNIEPEDLRALSVETSQATGMPLVGSDEVFRLQHEPSGKGGDT